MDHLHEHGDEPWIRHRRLHQQPRTWREQVRQFFWGFLFFEWYHELLPELQSWKHRQLEEPEIIEQAPYMH